MDSLDLIRQFLEENGVKAMRTVLSGTTTPGSAIWLPVANTHIWVSRSNQIRASIINLRRIFDLYDPASLPDLLECVLELEHGQSRLSSTISTE